MRKNRGAHVAWSLGRKGEIIMRIFVTGATGFIGSALVPELIQAGHTVLGLTRSEAGATVLRAAGAEVQHGSVEDLDSLRAGAANSDGVIHLAFNNDFSQFQKASEDDLKAIEAVGEVLVDSKRPFVVTSPTAVAMSVDGKPVTEDSPLAPWNPRAGSETAIKTLAERGVKTSIVRLSQVHDTHKQGAVSPAVQVARRKVSPLTSPKVIIAGLRYMSPTWRASIAWPSRRRNWAQFITQSAKKACL
jgi:nucleoside-diphosphate-sugar epimerase